MLQFSSILLNSDTSDGLFKKKREKAELFHHEYQVSARDPLR